MSLTRIQPSALDATQNYSVNTLSANTVLDNGIRTIVVANSAYAQANAAYAKANIPSGITYTTSNSAPSSPKLGDQWFNTYNNILFEYVSDGTSNLWIDTSSTTVSSNLGYATDTVAQAIATAAYGQANTGTSLATSAFATANISVGVDLVQNTNITLVGSYANSAYSKANAAISNTGGSITGQLNVAFTPSTVVNTAIFISAANTKGGTGYADFLSITNTSGGATNQNKWLRLGVSGTFEIINSTYTSTLFSMTDTGDLTLSGNTVFNGISGGYAPNRPGFRVIGANTSNINATSSAVTLTINNWALDWQQGSYLNQSTGIFTAPVTGVYSVCLTVRTQLNNYAGLSSMAVQKTTGGTTTNVCYVEFYNNTTMNHTGSSTLVKLTAGDTLKLVATTGQLTFDLNDSWSVAFIG